MASPFVTETGAAAEQFAGALRAAIVGSGLSLDRIRARLDAQGVHVSSATLSYWQSGRRRPERTESLAAVRALERVLALSPGALSSLIGPPRPRGTWGSRIGHLRPTWRGSAQVERAANELNTEWNSALSRISLHDRLTVGPDRREQSFWSRQVLRADVSGPDRSIVCYDLGGPGFRLPSVRILRGARLGEVIADADTGVLAAELLFDHPLARGETVVTEFELVNRAPSPFADAYDRTLPPMTREYVLEIQFSPPARPLACEQWRKEVDGATGGGHGLTSRPVTLDGFHCAQTVVLDPGACQIGLRWTWA